MVAIRRTPNPSAPVSRASVTRHDTRTPRKRHTTPIWSPARANVARATQLLDDERKTTMQATKPLLLPVASAVAAVFLAGSAFAWDGDNEHEHEQRRHRDAELRENVKTIVVIYAENRSFDNLFGRFPGADGLNEVLHRDGKPRARFIPQVDRDGSLLPMLPPTWGGVTAAGVTPVVTQAQSMGLANLPFAVETGFTPASGVLLST